MKTAEWQNCAGLQEGRYAHSMRDNCSSCAPWWERVPVCPDCHRKLQKMGRTKCKGCGVFVMVGQDPQNGEVTAP